MWKTMGIFGLGGVVGGKRLFCFTGDNVRFDSALLQNKDPIFENLPWKNPGPHFAACCLAGCRGHPPASEPGSRQGAAGIVVPKKLCWNQKEPARLARTLVRDVNFCCDHMLLELWCVWATDVLLEPSFSMLRFNSSDSVRIFLSELVLHALWLQIMIPSAVVLLLPSERQPFAKRNTFSSVNSTVRGER